MGEVSVGPQLTMPLFIMNIVPSGKVILLSSYLYFCLLSMVLSCSHMESDGDERETGIGTSPLPIESTASPIETTPQVEERCSDSESSGNCQAWQNQGYCLENSGYYQYMSMYCAGSCGFMNCDVQSDDVEFEAPPLPPQEV